MLRELRQEMFSEMVEAKDISQAGKFDDPGFLLYTNGQVQDYAAFCAGHARVYPTEISYAVEYDDEAWVEAGDRLGGPDVDHHETSRPGRHPHRGDLPGHLPAGPHPPAMGADLARLVTARSV